MKKRKGKVCFSITEKTNSDRCSTFQQTLLNLNWEKKFRPTEPSLAYLFPQSGKLLVRHNSLDRHINGFNAF